MQESIDKLLFSFADLLLESDEERITELELGLAKMGFEGIHLALPKPVDPKWNGIPVLAVCGRSNLRAWEADFRKNAVIVATRLDTGALRTWPLYPQKEKRILPQPKPPKPEGDAAGGRKYSCTRGWVGNGQSERLPDGEYSISLQYWDWVSDSKVALMPPKPGHSAEIPSEGNSWPWRWWRDHDTYFRGLSEMPTLEPGIGLAVRVERVESGYLAYGSLEIRARKSHLIAPADRPIGAAEDIQAGVRVDLLRFSPDQVVPEHEQFSIPVFSREELAIDNALRGSFALPVPFGPFPAETLLYVFADGLRAGPFKLPVSKG